MIRRLYLVSRVYWRNPLFTILAMMLVLSAFVSRALIFSGDYILGEEVWNVLFVATLWVVFYLGVLIKQQIATSRASLLPGYRGAHLIVWLMAYAGVFLLAAYWNRDISPGLAVTRDGLYGGYVSCVAVSIGIMYLGYLSKGRVFIYAYLASAVIALNVSACISAFEQYPVLVKIVLGFTMAGAVCFIHRLMTLRADHFEYPSILSWPPKVYLIKQIGRGRSGMFRQRPLPALSKYESQSGLLARALQWDPFLKSNVFRGIIVVAILTPVYIWLIHHQPDTHAFLKRAHTNFLLLSMTPILATLSGYYRNMAYWGYDLLRPVTREQYLRERGLVLALHLLVHWLFLIWMVAVVPAWTLQPEIFSTARFWLNLSLTGIIALLTMAWLTGLSCVSSARLIILNGCLLGFVVLFFIYFSDVLPTAWLVAFNFSSLCLLIGVVRLSYRYWLCKDMT